MLEENIIATDQVKPRVAWSRMCAGHYWTCTRWWPFLQLLKWTVDVLHLTLTPVCATWLLVKPKITTSSCSLKCSELVTRDRNLIIEHKFPTFNAAWSFCNLNPPFRHMSRQLASLGCSHESVIGVGKVCSRGGSPPWILKFYIFRLTV